ncbi:MAG: hypothetical protein HZA17_08185 [Nitrospirae bacterium]|nr:hypothetical protein [Nitrospirota bacterium]
MRNLSERVEEMFIAIAFAEEREVNHLKNISGRFTERLDDLFTAITFAEAGEFATAIDFAGGDSGQPGSHIDYCIPGLRPGMV